MNRIKSNLEDAGFTEITDPDSLTNVPDVLVIAFANQINLGFRWLLFFMV